MSEEEHKPSGPRPPRRERQSVWGNSKSTGVKIKQHAGPPVVLFIVLTTWSGRKLAVRYNSHHPFPMESGGDQGGAYVCFPQGLLYVMESTGEINAKIHRRLGAIQQAWVAA